jgi:hypothetical protein
MPSTVTITIPKLAEIRKAIAAGVATDVPLAISDFTGNHWTQADILGLVGAFLGAALLVFGVPNADAKKAVAAVAQVAAAVTPSEAPKV